ASLEVEVSDKALDLLGPENAERAVALAALGPDTPESAKEAEGDGRLSERFFRFELAAPPALSCREPHSPRRPRRAGLPAVLLHPVIEVTPVSEGLLPDGRPAQDGRRDARGLPRIAPEKGFESAQVGCG